MQKLLLILLFLVICGCGSWGLGESRANFAYEISRGTSRNKTQAVAIETLCTKLETEQEELLEQNLPIKETITQVKTRAKTVQNDIKYMEEWIGVARKDSGPPPEEFEFKSDKSIELLCAYAGLVYAKVSRWIAIQKGIERALDATVDLTSRVVKKGMASLPWWIRWGAYATILSTIGATIAGLWRWGLGYKRASHEAIDSFNQLPKDQRKEITKNAHYLGQIYEKRRSQDKVKEHKKNGNGGA